MKKVCVNVSGLCVECDFLAMIETRVPVLISGREGQAARPELPGKLRPRLALEEASRLLTGAGQQSAVRVRNLVEKGAEESIEFLLAKINGPGDQEQGEEPAEHTD